MRSTAALQPWQCPDKHCRGRTHAGISEVWAPPPGYQTPNLAPGVTGAQLNASGYVRFSYRGTYFMAHVWMFLYHNPGAAFPVAGHDVSHLCCNEWCCRPSHLALEPRPYGRTRETCVGFVYDAVTDTYGQVCRHNPPCMKVVQIAGLPPVVPPNGL